MRRVLFYVFLFLIGFSGQAQDFLTKPSSNPKLFKYESKKILGEKQQVFEAGFIYEYDTLSLPFIDDFSRDHLPKRVTDTADARVKGDTTYFAIFVDSLVYRDTFGFTTDTTYNYLVDSNGDTIQRNLNGPDTILFADVSLLKVPVYRELIVFGAFQRTDTLGGTSEFRQFEPVYVQDSARYFLVEADTNAFYTDRQVYVNNTYGINPPTIGIASFDGLNEYGRAYNFNSAVNRILADSLTSAPIDLSNLPDTNVYISFYYEPSGLSLDEVDREDSLVLEFFDATTRSWGNAWDTTSRKADSVFFKQIIVKVANRFQQNGFQFRFKNYGNPKGSFDVWHIDYIYLNNGRNGSDTVQTDIAFVNDAPSLLKDFYAVPYFHYISNPARYMADTALAEISNLADQQLSFERLLTVPDTTNGTNFYQFPSSSNFFQIPAKTKATLIFPLQFEFPINKVDSLGTFVSPISLNPTSITGEDFIPTNDTIFAKTVLRDYYAYDDGTAEAGYGVNPELGSDGRVAYVAVNFKIPFPDTLKGIQTYFLPQANDISNQTFVLSVWSSISPAAILQYEDTMSSTPVYSDDNGFVGYALDSALVVDTNFYVGIKSIGKYSMNMGYDLNTNNLDKIWWSDNGFNFNAPSAGIRNGSLMLRPVFRNRVFDVGINEVNSSVNELGEINIYPNPAKNLLTVDVKHFSLLNKVEVIDLSGKVVATIGASVNRNTRTTATGYASKIGVDVSKLNNGMYLLNLIDENGRVKTEKFIVNR